MEQAYVVHVTCLVQDYRSHFPQKTIDVVISTFPSHVMVPCLKLYVLYTTYPYISVCVVMYFVYTGSGNGISPILCHAINWVIADVSFVGFRIFFHIFTSRKSLKKLLVMSSGSNYICIHKHIYIYIFSENTMSWLPPQLWINMCFLISQDKGYCSNS